jgi:hypothetical protein
LEKIFEAKKGNPQANTDEWEKEIDELVYRFYELTPEEINIIEGGKLKTYLNFNNFLIFIIKIIILLLRKP